MPEPSLRQDGVLDLIAVGDISLGDSAQGVGDGVYTRFERVHRSRAGYPFELITGMLQGSDLVFGNIETVLSHDGLSRWSVRAMEMRGHPAIAERLALAGFNVLNVANNHTMQHGECAFTETVGALRRVGIGVVGVASDDHASCEPWVVSVNGLRVVVLGYAFENDKYATGPVAYAYAPDCDIVADVATAKKRADLVICSVHWGVEFVRHPTEAEEDLGRRLVDAGADVVLGHHPHVVRRVERYGRGVIAYSLGNFVFDMLWNPWLRTGLVLRVRLTRTGVQEVSTELIWIGDDYQPGPLSPEQVAHATAVVDDLQRRPDWVSSPGEYQRIYEDLVARNRRESHLHFVRRSWRRPVTYTLETLLRTAGRRIAAALDRT